jgi:hypothetical protein
VNSRRTVNFGIHAKLGQDALDLADRPLRDELLDADRHRQVPRPERLVQVDVLPLRNGDEVASLAGVDRKALLAENGLAGEQRGPRVRVVMRVGRACGSNECGATGQVDERVIESAGSTRRTTEELTDVDDVNVLRAEERCVRMESLSAPVTFESYAPRPQRPRRSRRRPCRRSGQTSRRTPEPSPLTGCRRRQSRAGRRSRRASWGPAECRRQTLSRWLGVEGGSRQGKGDVSRCFGSP